MPSLTVVGTPPEFDYFTTHRPSAAVYLALTGFDVRLLPQKPGDRYTRWSIPLAGLHELRKYERALNAAIAAARELQARAGDAR